MRVLLGNKMLKVLGKDDGRVGARGGGNGKMWYREDLGYRRRVIMEGQRILLVVLCMRSLLSFAEFGGCNMVSCCGIKGSRVRQARRRAEDWSMDLMDASINSASEAEIFFST